MARGRKTSSPTVYWIRLEMASGQSTDAQHRAALAALRDLYLARGVAKAEMITQSDLIRLAQDSISDAVTGLADEDESSTAEVGSAPLADEDKSSTAETKETVAP